ncbi:TonB-dependent receptor plug domain-containing protein [Thalassolituus sp. LLYu03]|uniref:TonB-dependent receptor plug domain-containing protein n=1 Tax=Thalassolituus sp. LLYu03 TaxID=3421656 RepID=UPI003D2AFA3D
MSMFSARLPGRPRFLCHAVCALVVLSQPVLAQTEPSDTSVSELGLTVVTASRTERRLDDTPVRTELISGDELRKTHARSLKDALENVAGLQLREIHGKSGYEATLQGMTSDQLLILIDGMPLAASTGSTVDLSQYALADVERIEVVKGAASAQYGSSAMGGVINVITRKPGTGFNAALTHDVGSYGGQNTTGNGQSVAQRHTNALIEGGNDQWQARLSADRRDTSGFDADDSNWVRQGDDSDRRQLAARLSWTPATGQYLALDLQQFREDDIQWLSEEIAGRYPNKFEAIERDRIALASGFTLGATRFTVKALSERYQSDSYKQNLGYSASYDNRDMTLDTGVLSLQADRPMTLWQGAHELQLGLDYRHESLTQFNNGVAEIGSSGSAARSNSEFFIQDDYFFSDQGELVTGVRLQQDSDFGAYTSPKIALKYRLQPLGDVQMLLRTSVGTGYRVPNLKERYYTFDHSSLGYMVLGNPDLKPESSLSYQAGVLLQFASRRELDINAFYNDIHDLIQTDTDNYSVVDGIAIYSYDNIDNARTYGLETVYRDSLTDSVSLNLSHTYTRAENTDTHKVLTRRPEHIGRFGADWEITPSLTLVGRVRYQSRELSSTSPDIWSPGWTTTDLKMTWQSTGWLTLFSGVDNVANRQRDFSSGTDFGPVAGRFTYLGFTLNY